MASHFSFPSRPIDPANWAERHGGLIVAVAVAMVTYAWLVTTVYQRVHRPTGQETRIVYRLPPPAPEPAPPEVAKRVEPMPVVAAPSLSEVAATSADAQPEAQLAEASDSGRPAAPVAPASLADWHPRTKEDLQFMAGAREKVTRHREALDQSQNEVAARINRERITSAGREFLLNTDGGKAGIIRTFDFKDYPKEVTAPILTRYGITIETKLVTPEMQTRKFINSATFSDGTFTNVQKSGYYEALVFSPKAVAMMAAKELTALSVKGFSPRDARIRKVVFGIVINADGDHDLDVIDIEVEKIR